MLAIRYLLPLDTFSGEYLFGGTPRFALGGSTYLFDVSSCVEEFSYSCTFSMGLDIGEGLLTSVILYQEDTPSELNEHVQEQENSSTQEETSKRYVLPLRANQGVPPKRYSPEKVSRGSRYPMANIAKGNLLKEAKAFSNRGFAFFWSRVLGALLVAIGPPVGVADESKALFFEPELPSPLMIARFGFIDLRVLGNQKDMMQLSTNPVDPFNLFCFNKKKLEKKAAEKKQRNTNKRKLEEVESEQPAKKKTNKQKIKCTWKTKKTGTGGKQNTEESASKYLNKASEEEKDEDRLRPVTESENEDLMVEKTKKEKKYRTRKETSTSKWKKMKKVEEEKNMGSDEEDGGSESENEELFVAKAKKIAKMKKKTHVSTSKSKKSRRNESEEEDYTYLEEEEEVKKFKKVKMDRAEEIKKSSKTVTYPTCNTRSSPKVLYEAMSGLSEDRKRCLKDIGFERYINFLIVELPSTLAYHEAEYSHLGKPTPPAIALQISGTHEADFMFKMNFITLFKSTMEMLENGGRVPTVTPPDGAWTEYVSEGSQTNNQKLEHSDDEIKDHDGNKTKMLGKSRTS
ncbi:hypothetical protein Tco_1309844 [Tanacetum coccineum]